MCNYTQTLHTLCGCKTVELLLLNQCRVALRNSMPFAYVAPHPDSKNSMPSLSFSTSSFYSMGFSPPTPPSPSMSFNSFSESPDYRSFTTSFEKQQQQDSFHCSLSFCPFHMEERLEKLEELSQRQEEDRRDLAKHPRAKARFPHRLRGQGRQRLPDGKEKQRKFDEERAEQLSVT